MYTALLEGASAMALGAARFPVVAIDIATGNTARLRVDGTLPVALFEDDQTGRPVPPPPAATGTTAPEIAVSARMAGSAVRATTMDRPAWIAVDPLAPGACCCPADTSRRGLINAGGTGRAGVDGAPMTGNGPNARAAGSRPDAALASRGRRPWGVRRHFGAPRDGLQPDRP